MYYFGIIKNLPQYFMFERGRAFCGFEYNNKPAK